MTGQYLRNEQGVAIECEDQEGESLEKSIDRSFCDDNAVVTPPFCTTWPSSQLTQ